MRVLQLNFSAGGSTGKIASSIHEMLLNKGEGFFAYGRGESSLPNTFKCGNEADFRLHTYLSRVTGLHGYYSHIPTAILISRVKKIKPDIVHLHNIHGGYVNIKMLLSFLSRENIKTVVTLHDCWMFTGGCAHYSVPPCENWKSQCGNCTRRNQYPKSYFFDTSKRCLEDKKKLLETLPVLQIVTVSHWLEDQVKQSFLKDRNITTIYNGIDTNIFYPHNNTTVVREKYHISCEKKIILGVASVWSDSKGLDLFLRLRKKLSDEFLIVLVGLTPKQITNLPIGILGITRTENQDELAAIYSIASLLINPSKEETFGMVAAESMACGTPVIVSDTTACPEIVDEETSFSQDLDDEDELLTRIQWMTKSTDENLAKICVERARSLFSNEKMVTNYWNLYNEMMGGEKNELASVQPY